MHASRFVLFKDWEAVLRISLDMRGLAFYLVSIEEGTAHAELTLDVQIQVTIVVLGLAYQEL